MATIDINVRNVSDNQNRGATLLGGNGQDSPMGFSDTLSDTLKKLNASIQNLNVTMSGLNKNLTPKEKKEKPPKEELSNSQKFWREAAAPLAGVIATALGNLTYRLATNQANAIMGTAVASGQFLKQAIAGNANGAFGAYAAEQVSVQRQKRIANQSTWSETGLGAIGGVFGTLIGAGLTAEFGGVGAEEGAVEGTALGKMFGKFLGRGSNKLLTVLGAGGLGATAGISGGKLIAANINQLTEQQMRIQEAMAQRMAEASVTQWKTPFARWGTPMSMTNIPGTNLNVPISRQFEQRYGRSQNYNQILNNIAPYLNSNPLNAGTNLDSVAQNFLKAGFAAQDFSRLTMQSAQYTAITGQNINKFSDDVKEARRKFGEGFGVDTMQNALNIMALGYSQTQSQQLAYQAQFNPGLANSLQSYNNMGISQFYAQRALSGSIGFDVNSAQQLGYIADPTARAEIRKELTDFHANRKYGRTLTLAGAMGHTPAELAYWIQDRAAINTNKNKYGTESGLSPAQQTAMDKINQIATEVATMNVQATHVNIMGGRAGGGLVGDAINAVKSYMAPATTSRSHSPAKK